MPKTLDSHFFRLPLEIRRHVYYHVLNHPTSILLGFSVARKYAHHWGRPSMSNLLLTCRQIYREAENVLYSSFCFEFMCNTDLETVFSALDLLSEQARASIRMIKFNIELNESSMSDVARWSMGHEETFQMVAEKLSGINFVNLSIVVRECGRHDIPFLTNVLMKPCRHFEKITKLVLSEGCGRGLHDVKQEKKLLRELRKRVAAKDW